MQNLRRLRKECHAHNGFPLKSSTLPNGEFIRDGVRTLKGLPRPLCERHPKILSFSSLKRKVSFLEPYRVIGLL
jgi:hypothetical protein